MFLLEGYTGMNCEININDCDPSPCENGAECEDLVMATRCHCLTGFTGEFCEINVDDCQHSYCENNSTCFDLING